MIKFATFHGYFLFDQWTKRSYTAKMNCPVATEHSENGADLIRSFKAA